MSDLIPPPTFDGYRSDEIWLIIVDHGSRRAESNDMLLEVVSMFERVSDYPIVEPAHMELAEPSIGQAFDRCVERGAKMIVVHPYFLLPGRHWAQDIPDLATAASSRHPGIKFLVTAPLGLHELMARIMDERIKHCLAHVGGDAESCPVCAAAGSCRVREG
ncbi:MAG: hypothetical protein MI802_09030 [Desulfobacterales bacterium]|nr:hypothetical protein [Desulfobacterales bacterium]